MRLIIVASNGRAMAQRSVEVAARLGKPALSMWTGGASAHKREQLRMRPAIRILKLFRVANRMVYIVDYLSSTPRWAVGQPPQLYNGVVMPPNRFLGEFEQMLLLAILQTDGSANAYEIRRELEESAARKVSKGAFYTTLDRLEDKGLLTWTAVPVQGKRGGLPQRFFRVTPHGVAELRRSRNALLNLWRGLDEVLG